MVSWCFGTSWCHAKVYWNSTPFYPKPPYGQKFVDTCLSIVSFKNKKYRVSEKDQFVLALLEVTASAPPLDIEYTEGFSQDIATLL